MGEHRECLAQRNVIYYNIDPLKLKFTFRIAMSTIMYENSALVYAQTIKY